MAGRGEDVGAMRARTLRCGKVTQWATRVVIRVNDIFMALKVIVSSHKLDTITFSMLMIFNRYLKDKNFCM